MSYHSDYHEFDFDSDLIDALCPMTDLDHLIAKYGTEKALNKFNKKKTRNKDKNDRRKQNNQDSVND